MNETELNLALDRLVAERKGFAAPPTLQEEIWAIPATTPPEPHRLPIFDTERFQTMYSAAKFVVAGVVVALVGGFLLTGVLTQQGEETAPIVGASASASRDVRSDLLRGVDLEVEEVSPGIFRVLSDGSHDLRKNVWQVAVSAGGEVWVEKHRAHYVTRGGDKGQAFGTDYRVIRLGDEDTYLRGDNEIRLVATDDGGLLADGRRRGFFDGQSWVKPPASAESYCYGLAAAAFETDPSLAEVRLAYGTFLETAEAGDVRRAPDGSCWGTAGYGGEGAVRLDALGELRVFRGEDVGLDREWFSSPVVFSHDGSAWVYIEDEPGLHGLAAFDGQEWTRVGQPSGPDRAYKWDVEVAPDGIVWALFDTEAGYIAGSLEGSVWTSHGLIADDAGTLHVALEPRIQLLPDGKVWVGTLAVHDATALRRVPLPHSGTNRQPVEWEVARTPDGSLWVTVVNLHEESQPRCTRQSREGRQCVGETDGLYVITPEAMAATK